MNGLEKLRGLLGLPFFYNFLQNAIGVPRQREFLVQQFVRPRQGDRILDIGCGTADILVHLQPFEVHYTGIEPNEAYVRYARRKWNDQPRYQFQLAAIGTSVAPSIAAHAYDVALAFGVMHHLPDEAVRQLLQIAAEGLKPGGRLVTMDPCRLPDMNLIEKLMVKYDRGCYIREVADYASLMKSTFHSVQHTVKAMANIPSRAVVFDCGAPLSPAKGSADAD